MLNWLEVWLLDGNTIFRLNYNKVVFDISLVCNSVIF
jgi:hypothetical protein